MHTKGRFPNLLFGPTLRPESAALAIMLMLLFLIFLLLFLTVTAQPAQAQTFKVIYNFTGATDGAYPVAGLTMDQSGNLYGTATFGGFAGGGCTIYGLVGCGTVFKLAPSGSGWTFSSLYNFRGGTDGAWPYSKVIFGPDGSLYGTTSNGGNVGPGAFEGCGTVFNLKPPATPLSSWSETVIYRFKGGGDGSGPLYGGLTFDPAGNIYGTTDGGGYCRGKTTVYQLAPTPGGWTESVLHAFSGGSDGSGSGGGLILDQAGNLYGTSMYGGNLGGSCTGLGCGTVFQLVPSASGWIKNVLYSFRYDNDGAWPYAGLVFDQSGNLYGATSVRATAFELSPSGGGWSESVLYNFPGGGPTTSLVMDAAGSLYGTSFSGGAHGSGNVFKLSRSGSGWTYTSLYDFTGGSDGGGPVGGVMLDAQGNLYGTTQNGGTGSNCYYRNCGVVFEITP